jgi:acyl-CoA reductase-like NAD-dependent aldehyde dehydrogenase
MALSSLPAAVVGPGSASVTSSIWYAAPRPARRALSGPWATLSHPERADVLNRIGGALRLRPEQTAQLSDP